MEHFKRDPAGVPHEIQQIYARTLFARLKGNDDALGHTEGDQRGADSSSDSDPNSGDRMRHVVNVMNRLFVEVEAAK